jgi:hypothetical protein
MSAPGAGYFLYHSIGMFPDKARLVAEALARLGAVWGTPDDSQWDASLAIRAQFVDRWRQLIGAPAGTMTTAENVTTALHSVVGSLPEDHLRGRRLLIASDCFPGIHFLLSGMAARHGYTLDTVTPRPGENWVRDEDFIARWDAEVGVALITFVTSHSSHRCDLSALLTHGRKMRSLVGVDIAQGVARLVQPGRHLLVDAGQLQVRTGCPALRSWDALRHGLRGLAPGARMACGAGPRGPQRPQSAAHGGDRASPAPAARESGRSGATRGQRHVPAARRCATPGRHRSVAPR